MLNLMLVALGSAAGGVARWLVGGALQRRLMPAEGTFPFPVGTLFVNVTGSFVLGALMMYLVRQGDRGDAMRLLVAVGFCGGYTTFSTFSMETVVLIEEGAFRLAALNVVTSVALAIAATFGGMLLMRALLARTA